MDLIPWQHPTRHGFTLRGWHSRPSGKPLLHFLHGNGFCGRVYEPMLTHLGQHYDLWLSDAQGHGDSDHGERFVGWNRSADLAVEAFKAQGQAFAGVTPFIVLDFLSLGLYVAFPEMITWLPKVLASCLQDFSRHGSSQESGPVPS